MTVHQIIINGIKEQLFFNNYLVLPNFGGFILKQTPSHFSASGGMLMPPSKTISFNAQLKQNDGILVQWLRTNLPCSGEEAIAHLSDFSEYCKSILNNRGRLTIDGLGFFYADLENNICFEPQQQVNFLTSSFGLSPVSIKEIEPELPQNREAVFADRFITSNSANQNDNSNTLVKKPRNYRKAAVIAVSGVLLLSSLLFVVSNAKLTGQLKASLFGKGEKMVYAPFTYNELNLKSLNSVKKDYVADANGVAILDLDNNKVIAVQAIENTASDTRPNDRKNINIRSAKKNFEIVLGCFGVLNNAKKMVKKLKSENINAELSGQNNKGLYVVASGNFETKEEALANLSQFKNVCPNAWVKKGE